MINTLLKKIKFDFFLILLIFISIFLCYKNYTPGTILSGWDTLHPEFNLSLYWQRITSVWQTHQGLGAPSAQSHQAEIPRMLIIGLFYLIFPLSFVRYAYFFLMLILGPLGVYYLLKYLLKSPERNLNVSIASFLGALFYLLNLGTMQNFIAPLEMFATKYGYLGFLYLFAIKFLNEGKKKNLIIFSVFTLLASPMAHTATLWYTYFAGLVLFLLTYAILQRKFDKKIVILIGVTLLLNLYWILPNIYYSVNYSNDLINSKINRLSSEETYYYNKKYGNISDFLLLKNFLFDWRVSNNQSKIEYLLSSWKTHLNNPFIPFWGYLTFLMGIGGIILSVKKKNKLLISFIPILFMSAFFLLSNVPIIGLIFDWLRNQNQTLKEILRSPFTKFSIYMAFTISIFFGYTHKILLDSLESFIKKNNFSFLISLYFYFFIFSQLIFFLPGFQGNFISPIERVKIPAEYYSLFNWSKKQDNGRMLTLPMNSLFGWVYYKWNLPEQTQVYQGGGFNWFGISQPTLNREFDRWYPYNEQSYREFSYAIYSQNLNIFQKLLAKYQIKYILMDENTFIPDDLFQDKKLFYQQTKQLLRRLSKIKKMVSFGNKISIYENQAINNPENFTYINNYKNIAPSFHWSYIDQAYLDFGDYITDIDNPQNNTYYYPEREILTANERLNNKRLSIFKNLYQFTFNSNNLSDNKIKIPDLYLTETEFYVDIYATIVKNKPQLIINYLLPYFAGRNILQQQIELPSNKIDNLIISNQLFVLPQLIDNNPIYLGETVFYTKNQNWLSFYYNSKPQIVNIPLLQSSTSINNSVNNNIIDGFIPEKENSININQFSNNISDCQYAKSEVIDKKIVKISDQNTVQYTTRNGNACDFINFSNLSYNMNYIIAIESKNISGLSLKVCLRDIENQICVLDDELSKNKDFGTDYFILPAYNQGFGYNLELSNESIGNINTVNQIRNISFIPFAYNFFRSIKQESKSNLTPFSLLISNSQAFEKNWNAYIVPSIIKNNPILHYLSPIFGQKLTNHILVNNWENGWLLDNINHKTNNIVIIYLPQYLEFLGFALLIISFIYIVFFYPKKKITS